MNGWDHNTVYQHAISTERAVGFIVIHLEKGWVIMQD